MRGFERALTAPKLPETHDIANMTVCIPGGITTHRRTSMRSVRTSLLQKRTTSTLTRLVQSADCETQRPAALRAQPPHRTTTLPSTRRISKTSWQLGVHDAPQSNALTATAKPRQRASNKICRCRVINQTPSRSKLLERSAYTTGRACGEGRSNQL